MHKRSIILSCLSLKSECTPTHLKSPSTQVELWTGRPSCVNVAIPPSFSSAFIFSRSKSLWPMRRCRPSSRAEMKRCVHPGTLHVKRALRQASSPRATIRSRFGVVAGVVDVVWPPSRRLGVVAGRVRCPSCEPGGAVVVHGMHSAGHAADMNWSTKGVDVARNGDQRRREM